jgi:hypothetical protein
MMFLPFLISARRLSTVIHRIDGVGEATKAEGLTQTARYMDALGAKQGWLVIFDRRASVSWEDKLYFDREESDGKQIAVVGC